CAWHDYTGSSYGDLAFTNMPYVTDLGQSCGQNFVNSGSAGTLDGFSIVNGHEYAETITDQNPPGGWTNWLTGEENADECALIRTCARVCETFAPVADRVPYLALRGMGGIDGRAGSILHGGCARTPGAAAARPAGNVWL